MVTIIKFILESWCNLLENIHFLEDKSYEALGYHQLRFQDLNELL